MAYENQTYGRAQRGGRLGEEAGARHGDVEEEPTELDKPETDDLGEDDYEDSLGLAEDGLDSQDDADDDEEEDRPSPLAEDTPIRGRRQPRQQASKSTKVEDDDLEDMPGVRTSGGSDAAAMSESDRRREFPRVLRSALPVGSAGKRRKSARRGARKIKIARA